MSFTIEATCDECGKVHTKEGLGFHGLIMVEGDTCEACHRESCIDCDTNFMCDCGIFICSHCCGLNRLCDACEIEKGMEEEE